jgi:hypothetical protein
LQGIAHWQKGNCYGLLCLFAAPPTHTNQVVFSVTLFAPIAQLAIPPTSCLSRFISNPIAKQKNRQKKTTPPLY